MSILAETPQAMARATSVTIPGLIKRNTLYLATAQAFVGAGFSLVPTLGAIMVVRLLGSASLAGIATSLLGVSRFIVSYPVGKITDIYGRKVGVILGLVVGLMGAVLLAFSVLASSFLLFLIGILIFGMGMGAAQQLRVAAADMYPASRRGEGMAYVLTGSVVGVFGGPIIIGGAEALAPSFGIPAMGLAWSMVPLFIIPALFLVLRVHPDPREIASNLERYYPDHRPERSAGPGEDGGVTMLTFLRHYPKLTAFVATFGVQGNMSMMMAMTSLVLSYSGYSLSAISVFGGHPRDRHVRLLAAAGKAQRPDRQAARDAHRGGHRLGGGRPHAHHHALLGDHGGYVPGGSRVVVRVRIGFRADRRHEPRTRTGPGHRHQRHLQQRVGNNDAADGGCGGGVSGTARGGDTGPVHDGRSNAAAATAAGDQPREVRVGLLCLQSGARGGTLGR